MIALLVRRTLFLIPVLLGGSAIVFFLIHSAPGDPIDALMGMYASPEAREALRIKYGLNDPLLAQYFRWLGLVLQGDWGMSIQQRVPVLPLVLEKFWITILLTSAASLFAAIVGISAGIISAVKQNSWIDHLILILSVFALSMPPYWLGLIAIFVFSVQLGWLPTGGLYSFSGQMELFDVLKHLIMPAIVAGLTPAAIIARVTRAAMLEVLKLDFMTALRAKGLRERTIVLGHAFRNALPTVVSMTGLQIGYLILGAALFVEIIFSWPGLGLEIYKSVVGRDMPMMLGLVLFSTFIFVVLNLAVDIIYRVINPRVREA
ncbi:ABC transporter permease [Mesorhizobium escarrei]|uniref:Glutathione ABC transporter membrane subunit GsiC n=1 Tax=Mesorhizobium escarrei TaxID=666018 RepID=A0ABN8K772_9HYPH|nr:ABC transporter permease [Mesorhizobium escarrei]CAH2406139.1 glutathione ABC transporter membrane subunit GsiC [Mesorhizobium escarrei]